VKNCRNPTDIKTCLIFIVHEHPIKPMNNRKGKEKKVVTLKSNILVYGIFPWAAVISHLCWNAIYQNKSQNEENDESHVGNNRPVLLLRSSTKNIKKRTGPTYFRQVWFGGGSTAICVKTLVIKKGFYLQERGHREPARSDSREEGYNSVHISD